MVSYSLGTSLHLRFLTGWGGKVKLDHLLIFSGGGGTRGDPLVGTRGSHLLEHRGGGVLNGGGVVEK